MNISKSNNVLYTKLKDKILVCIFIAFVFHDRIHLLKHTLTGFTSIIQRQEIAQSNVMSSVIQYGHAVSISTSKWKFRAKSAFGKVQWYKTGGPSNLMSTSSEFVTSQYSHSGIWDWTAKILCNIRCQTHATTLQTYILCTGHW